MKKLSKKKQIQLSIISGLLIVIILIVAIFINLKKSEKPAETSYQTVTLEQTDPLLFKGVVQAEKIEEVYYDQTLGKISNIAIKDGQEVKEKTVLLTYQNETVEDQASEQEQSIDKLNLAVSNAQQNLDNAYQKQSDLTNKREEARLEYNRQDSNSEKGAAKQQELEAKIEQYDQSLDAQKEAISQAQQSLDAATLDLTDANETIEKTKKKVTTNIAATSTGIAYVNLKGKTDPSVPLVTIVSPNTVIEGTVSEYDYTRVKKGKKVTLRAMSESKEINGTISEVNQLPQATTAQTTGTQTTMANYTFLVKPDESLQYGYSVEITLPIDELRIPNKAVIKEKDQTFVYLYQKGKVKKQAVKVEEVNGVTILKEGLKQKDQLISNPDSKLKDGQEVAVN